MTIPHRSPQCVFLWDPSCPNVDVARERLREALVSLQMSERVYVREHHCDDPSLPLELRGYASPTILVDGLDVSGGSATCGEGCRIYSEGDSFSGAPAVAEIVKALQSTASPSDRVGPEDQSNAAASEGLLVLVRHGETVGNSAIRLYGATDIELSALGEAQVERAAALLRAEVFDQLVTSPLCRARRSAEIVAEALESKPEMQVVEALRERNFGDWEGWTVDEVAARDPEAYRRWRSDGVDFSFPGGESQRGLRARVLGALQGGAEGPLFGAQARSLAVLHKGIIKMILGALLGLEYAESSALPVALGSVHRLRCRSGHWQLEAANIVDHLGEHYLES